MSDPGGVVRTIQTFERVPSERRLGWLLSAPAVIAMLLVSAYPAGRALYLSLFSYGVSDPGGREYIGLRNYRTILTNSLWWSDVWTTAGIALVIVVVELGLGFAL